MTTICRYTETICRYTETKAFPAKKKKIIYQAKKKLYWKDREREIVKATGLQPLTTAEDFIE